MDRAAPIRVLIVDDEPPAVERLSTMVSAFADCEVVGCESRTDRVLDRCRRTAPDTVLLDVEMPGADGLDLAEEMRRMERPPAVIFITAHDQYAVRAFGVEAVDYVVKPVRSARLRQALDRVGGARGDDKSFIAAHIGDRLVRIALDEIRAFTAEDKSTLVHAIDARAVVDEPLKAIERRHGDRFVRVHRNTLASRHHLRALFTDRAEVTRVEIDGTRLRPEVSRRNLTVVKKLLKGAV